MDLGVGLSLWSDIVPECIKVPDPEPFFGPLIDDRLKDWGHPIPYAFVFQNLSEWLLQLDSPSPRIRPVESAADQETVGTLSHAHMPVGGCRKRVTVNRAGVLLPKDGLDITKNLVHEPIRLG